MRSCGGVLDGSGKRLGRSGHEADGGGSAASDAASFRHLVRLLQRRGAGPDPRHRPGHRGLQAFHAGPDGRAVREVLQLRPGTAGRASGRHAHPGRSGAVAGTAALIWAPIPTATARRSSMFGARLEAAGTGTAPLAGRCHRVGNQAGGAAEPATSGSAPSVRRADGRIEAQPGQRPAGSHHQLADRPVQPAEVRRVASGSGERIRPRPDRRCAC